MALRLSAVIFLGVSILWAGPARVFILSGQSNMEGFGKTHELGDVAKYMYQNVKVYMAGSGRNFTKFGEILAPEGPSGRGCFGPEIGIAEVLSRHTADRQIYIKLAWGGTGMDHWLHDSLWMGAGRVYPWFVEHLDSALNAIGEEFILEGVFWMQGETDACTARGAEAYDTNLMRFVQERVRGHLSGLKLEKWLNKEEVDSLPFIFGKIKNQRKKDGSYLWPYVETLHTRQEMAAEKIPYAALTSETSDSLATVWPSEDWKSGFSLAHYNTQGCLHVGHKLGIRMAEYLAEHGRDGWIKSH